MGRLRVSRDQYPVNSARVATARPTVMALVFAVATASLLLCASIWLDTTRHAEGRAAMAARAERENQIAAQLVAHLVVDWLDRRDQWGYWSAQEWPADAELDLFAIPMLDAEIRDRIASLNFVGLRMFNRAGRTIFSTTREEIGSRVPDMRRFLQARDGRSASATRPGTGIRGLDGEYRVTVTVSTYLPLQLAPGRPPDAILELSSDVGDVAAQTEAELRRDAHVLAASFGAIYLFLVTLVGIGARSIRRAQIGLVAAKRDVERSEERFRDLAETASDWFWETDAQGVISFSSIGPIQSGAEAFSVGMRLWGGATSMDMAPLARCLEISERRAFRDFEFKTGDGATGGGRTVLLSGRPVFSGGVFAGYRGTGRDVTILHEANQRLVAALDREREATLQQRRFLAIAAHEFRTPLSIIDGSVQRILRNLASIDAADLRERVTRIRRAVSRMSETVDKTLNAARIDEGRVEINPRAFEMAALVRVVCRRLQTIAPDFSFNVTAPESGASTLADVNLTDQVLTNLITNAIKYSAESRRIDIAISVDQEAASVEVAVQDYGIGIPLEEQANLFTRFFRASTAKGLPGTGIGLSLVRDLVQLHGGTVDFASEPGKGSRFVVRLPSVSQATEAA
jgi:signal transduction histidine kinase